MKTVAFLYSSKIWLTVAFITPFLQCAIEFLKNPAAQVGEWLYYAVSVGLIFSIPSLFLFWLVTLNIKTVAFNQTLSKLLLTMAGIVLAVLLLYMAYRMPQFASAGPYLPIPYIIAVVAAIWMYELPELDGRRYTETANA